MQERRRVRGRQGSTLRPNHQRVRGLSHRERLFGGVSLRRAKLRGLHALRELERLRIEADQARRAQEEAQREADKRRDEVAQEARRAAHDAAARALETEVTRVRAEAEAGLRADLERLRKEAAEARLRFITRAGRGSVAG